jgi:hypothetical protein
VIVEPTKMPTQVGNCDRMRLSLLASEHGPPCIGCHPGAAGRSPQDCGAGPGDPAPSRRRCQSPDKAVCSRWPKGQLADCLATEKKFSLPLATRIARVMT